MYMEPHPKGGAIIYRHVIVVAFKKTRHGHMDVQGCIGEVLKVSRDVSNASESEILRNLLKLKHLLDCQSLDASGVRQVKTQIWKSDLIHVIVEILRQDFSLVKGQWDTAAQLAQILSSVCTGLKPKIQKAAHSHEFTRASQTPDAVAETEQVKEYYNILLPTAVDSLLILANSLLEAISTSENHSPNSGFETSENLTHFQSILDALAWLCAGHKQCIPRAIQSPYLLHILITDDSHCCQVVIATLKKLVKGDKSVLGHLPGEIIQGLLDEMVYKLSGNDQTTAVPSLKLLASFVRYCPSLLEVILSRYTGLLIVASKWRSHELGTDVEHLFNELEAASITQREVSVVNSAAIVIQAAWRGYATRMKVKKMQRGIRRFQLLYRRRKAEKAILERKDSRKKNLHNAKRIVTQSSLRSFHEKQMMIVTQLPASEVEHFVQKQTNQAAVKIQSWWRAKTSEKWYRSQKHQRKRTASAIVIQKAYRTFVQKKRQSVERKASLLYPEIKGQEREALQKEVAQYRELHPPAYKSEEQLRLLHENVQGLLEEFYSKGHLRKRREERQRLLLSQLDRDCELLMSAPSLTDATQETVQTFSSGSANVARMAQTAHREELRAMEMPWWKHPMLDTEINF